MPHSVMRFVPPPPPERAWRLRRRVLGVLPGAVNVDIYSPDFEKRLAALDKNAPLYLYCRSGGRSGQALSKAKALGFKKAVHLSGGILAWEAQGKKTVK